MLRKKQCFFLSRWCTCSHQLRPPTLSPCLTTVPRPHRAALHSLALRCASPPHRVAEPVGLAQLLLFLPSHCVCVSVCLCCCCCCLVSTYADERRRHIPPSPLSEGRFQFAFTFLLAGTIGFRAVPVNSPPFSFFFFFSQHRVDQQQLGNIWPPQSARLPVPPPARLGSLLWKLV